MLVGWVLDVEQVVQDIPDIASAPACVAFAHVQDNDTIGLRRCLWLHRKGQSITAREMDGANNGSQRTRQAPRVQLG